jgi:hypothetical protein
LDEDFEPATNAPPSDPDTPAYHELGPGPREEGPDFGDADDATASGSRSGSEGAAHGEDVAESTVEFVRPFADLKELPEDLAEAFEAFKLAILRHKMADWQDISCKDVLASLDALKQLVLAP